MGGPLIRSNSHEALPLKGGSVQSSNWSGYAVTPSVDNVTAVTSTFTVPTAGLVLPGFSANWAGIGGYSSTDLIQAGVAEDSVPTNPLLGDQYYAWYELLPGDAVQLTDCTGDTSCTVNPGDVVSVDIFQTANDVWTIDVSDSGHWSWTDTDVPYTSTHSSAEWILEAPQVDGLPTLVAGDGTSFFGPTSTYTVGSGAPRPSPRATRRRSISPPPRSPPSTWPPRRHWPPTVSRSTSASTPRAAPPRRHASSLTPSVAVDPGGSDQDGGASLFDHGPVVRLPVVVRAASGREHLAQ